MAALAKRVEEARDDTRSRTPFRVVADETARANANVRSVSDATAGVMKAPDSLEIRRLLTEEHERRLLKAAAETHRAKRLATLRDRAFQHLMDSQARIIRTEEGRFKVAVKGLSEEERHALFDPRFSEDTIVRLKSIYRARDIVQSAHPKTAEAAAQREELDAAALLRALSMSRDRDR